MSKEYIADKETLDEVNQKVGVNTDAASGTSLFAKVNSLLNTVANHVAAWTSARAAKLDKLDNIGATNDTGGSTTAGTVLAKLNALLSSWTSTRAGYLDKLNNSTYGLEAIKNNLSEHKEWIAIAGTSYTALNFKTETGGPVTAGTFTVPANGIYKLEANVTITNNNNSAYGTTLQVRATKPTGSDSDFSTSVTDRLSDISPGTNKTLSISKELFFRKGEKVTIQLGCNIGGSSPSTSSYPVKINSGTIKYSKQIV